MKNQSYLVPTKVYIEEKNKFSLISEYTYVNKGRSKDFYIQRAIENKSVLNWS